MRMSWLLCALVGTTLAWGQAAPSAAPPMRVGTEGAAQVPAANADKSASLPAETTVITIKGVCPAQPKTTTAAAGATKSAKTASAAKTTPANCETKVSKAEFEKLAGAMAPAVTPQLKGSWDRPTRDSSLFP